MASGARSGCSGCATFYEPRGDSNFVNHSGRRQREWLVPQGADISLPSPVTDYYAFSIRRALPAASAAVACGAEGGCSGTRAYYKPEGVAMEALPECAAFGGGDCGVAFACEGREFCGVVGGILLGGG